MDCTRGIPKVLSRGAAGVKTIRTGVYQMAARDTRVYSSTDGFDGFSKRFRLAAQRNDGTRVRPSHAIRDDHVCVCVRAVTY